MKRLLILAVVLVAVHTLLNGRYGFHRDELAMFDDARHLAWGYVAYPPFTAFVGRIAWELFGSSLTGLRFFAALAQAAAIILSGLMARDLGGNRGAQFMAGAAVAVAPLSIAAGELFQYVTFDYLWWVLTAWFLIRLLKSEDARWWLGIGASVGFGLMTKYTIGVLVIAMGAGLLLTPARRYLKSWWLLAGIGGATLIFLPNVVWELQHHLITADFLRSIHARDVRIGRADDFLLNQLYVPDCVLTIPIWVAGLYFYFSKQGERYRPIGWMFAFSLLVFFIAKGRDYYMAPAYPMLMAAGSLVLTARAPRLTWAAISVGAALGVLLLQIPPVDSAWWRDVNGTMYDFREEIGWPELVAQVATVWNSLPPEDRTSAAIFASNYGEAGAIDLYGPAHGLPTVISAANSYWLRGYPEPAPKTLVVVGSSQKSAERYLESCVVAGHVTNSLGVRNDESRGSPSILVCRNPRMPWPEIWKRIRSFQ